MITGRVAVNPNPEAITEGLRGHGRVDSFHRMDDQGREQIEEHIAAIDKALNVEDGTGYTGTKITFEAVAERSGASEEDVWALVHVMADEELVSKHIGRDGFTVTLRFRTKYGYGPDDE